MLSFVLSTTFISTSSRGALSVTIANAETLLAAPNNESVKAITVLLNNFIFVSYQFYVNWR